MNPLLQNNLTSHGASARACQAAEPCSVIPSETQSSLVRHSGGSFPDDPAGVDRYILTRADFADLCVAQKPVVVLAGAWPQEQSKLVVELDSTIDCRYTWLDREAEHLAELAGGGLPDYGAGLPAPWVNALGLRYYLVKLLRVIEYFSSVEPPQKGQCFCLIADRADGDDVAIITTICRRAGAECHVRWRGSQPDAEPSVTEPEEWWRRSMRILANRLQLPGHMRRGGSRVVLCGNPRFLDPLCQVLHERKCRIWWLYDRFAVKPFWRWHLRGIPQLTCQNNPHRDDEPGNAPIDLPPLPFRGIDLHDLVLEWLNRRLAGRRRDQRRWLDQIDRHFQQIRPNLLVMDEDATPMKRIALAAARHYGGKSFVVQHGAPVARFGFAPLAADGLFAWGLSTREQLQRWDIPSERVLVTGSPSHDSLQKTLRRSRAPQQVPSGSPPRILLLATVPPRDCRPDVIELNLNSRSYGEMIEAAFAAAEAIPGATLVLKPHPRTKTDLAIEQAISRHPHLRVEPVRSGSLAQSLRGIDCVLSCLSSAGIEATLADVPVIQLVPRGAGQVLPSERWGLLGSASSAAELLPVLEEALQRQSPATNAAREVVFAGASFWRRESTGVSDSATRIADILLDHEKQSPLLPRKNEEQGCSMAIARN